MTDSTSYDTACEKGIDVFENLRGHACFEALDAIGDAVFTGNTGTNLCDFNIMYVPELPAKKLKGSRIKKVHARQIIDCKCRPMVRGRLDRHGSSSDRLLRRHARILRSAR